MVLLHQVCGSSASWWQFMDRSTASTPVLALKSDISAPPDFREMGTIRLRWNVIGFGPDSNQATNEARQPACSSILILPWN